MELNEVLLARRSVRKYTEEIVSDDMIAQLMHAAMSGPSACNIRPWEFHVIRDAEKLAQLRSATRYSNITAPLAIVVVGNITGLPRVLAPYWIQDCSAATENILLRATDLGLGTVWCGVYPQEQEIQNVSTILGLSDKQIPLNIIHVGHPAENPQARDQYDSSKVFIH